MAATGATLWAVNGTVSKVILASGIDAQRLSQVRSTGAFAGLALVVGLTRPAALRVRARDLPFLAFFGIVGLAFVQWFYFIAIHRLEIAVALLIQYTAPLLVALWARFVYREHVRRRIWVALVLALGGLSLVLDAWHGVTLDTLGVVASVVASVTYALYLLLAERALVRRDPVSLLTWGFLFAALFWAVARPWWTFPFGRAAASVSLLGRLDGLHLPVWVLMASVIVLGTIVPFTLVVAALRHLRATRVGIVAMVEPVVATVVAYVWLAESLGVAQVVGGAIVLTAIGLAQTAR
jgi:drug/metabolite transporter (DMT)-like permease